MIKIAVVMNCHWRPAQAALAKLLTGNCVIECFQLDSPARDNVELQTKFMEHMNAADLIFYQYNSTKILSNNNIVDNFKNKSFLVSNFYFRGLHPDACYVGSFHGRLPSPFPYNSIVILDSFKRGLSVTECMAQFSRHNFERLGLLDTWVDSLSELERRDNSVSAVVNGSTLIEEHAKVRPLFFTFNHPMLFLIKEYYKRVLGVLNINYTDFDTMGLTDPLYNHCIYPVFDLVAEAMGLDYRVSQLWRLRAKYSSLEEMISRFYSAYEAVEDRASLVINSPVHAFFTQNRPQFDHLIPSHAQAS